MSDRISNINTILHSWQMKSQIKGFSVISRTGLSLINALQEVTDINQVSAMIAATVEAMENAASCIKAGRLKKMKVELNPVNFLIYRLGETEILIILCDNERKMRKIEKTIPYLFRQLQPFL